MDQQTPLTIEQFLQSCDYRALQGFAKERAIPARQTADTLRSLLHTHYLSAHTSSQPSKTTTTSEPHLQPRRATRSTRNTSKTDEIAIDLDDDDAIAIDRGPADDARTRKTVRGGKTAATTAKSKKTSEPTTTAPPTPPRPRRATRRTTRRTASQEDDAVVVDMSDDTTPVATTPRRRGRPSLARLQEDQEEEDLADMTPSSAPKPTRSSSNKTTPKQPQSKPPQQQFSPQSIRNRGSQIAKFLFENEAREVGVSDERTTRSSSKKAEDDQPTAPAKSVKSTTTPRKTAKKSAPRAKPTKFTTTTTPSKAPFTPSNSTPNKSATRNKATKSIPRSSPTRSTISPPDSPSDVVVEADYSGPRLTRRSIAIAAKEAATLAQAMKSPKHVYQPTTTNWNVDFDITSDDDVQYIDVQDPRVRQQHDSQSPLFSPTPTPPPTSRIPVQLSPTYETIESDTNDDAASSMSSSPSQAQNLSAITPHRSSRRITMVWERGQNIPMESLITPDSSEEEDEEKGKIQTPTQTQLQFDTKQYQSPQQKQRLVPHSTTKKRTHSTTRRSLGGDTDLPQPQIPLHSSPSSSDLPIEDQLFALPHNSPTISNKLNTTTNSNLSTTSTTTALTISSQLSKNPIKSALKKRPAAIAVDNNTDSLAQNSSKRSNSTSDLNDSLIFDPDTSFTNTASTSTRRGRKCVLEQCRNEENIQTQLHSHLARNSNAISAFDNDANSGIETEVVHTKQSSATPKSAKQSQKAVKSAPNSLMFSPVRDELHSVTVGGDSFNDDANNLDSASVPPKNVGFAMEDDAVVVFAAEVKDRRKSNDIGQMPRFLVKFSKPDQKRATMRSTAMDNADDVGFNHGDQDLSDFSDFSIISQTSSTDWADTPNNSSKSNTHDRDIANMNDFDDFEDNSDDLVNDPVTALNTTLNSTMNSSSRYSSANTGAHLNEDNNVGFGPGDAISTNSKSNRKLRHSIASISSFSSQHNLGQNSDANKHLERNSQQIDRNRRFSGASVSSADSITIPKVFVPPTRTPLQKRRQSARFETDLTDNLGATGDVADQSGVKSQFKDVRDELTPSQPRNTTKRADFSIFGDKEFSPIKSIASPYYGAGLNVGRFGGNGGDDDDDDDGFGFHLGSKQQAVPPSSTHRNTLKPARRRTMVHTALNEEPTTQSSSTSETTTTRPTPQPDPQDDAEFQQFVTALKSGGDKFRVTPSRKQRGRSQLFSSNTNNDDDNGAGDMYSTIAIDKLLAESQQNIESTHPAMNDNNLFNSSHKPRKSQLHLPLLAKSTHSLDDQPNESKTSHLAQPLTASPRSQSHKRKSMLGYSEVTSTIDQLVSNSAEFDGKTQKSPTPRFSSTLSITSNESQDIVSKSANRALHSAHHDMNLLESRLNLLYDQQSSTPNKNSTTTTTTPRRQTQPFSHHQQQNTPRRSVPYHTNVMDSDEENEIRHIDKKQRTSLPGNGTADPRVSLNFLTPHTLSGGESIKFSPKFAKQIKMIQKSPDVKQQYMDYVLSAQTQILNKQVGSSGVVGTQSPSKSKRTVSTTSSSKPISSASTRTSSLLPSATQQTPRKSTLPGLGIGRKPLQSTNSTKSPLRHTMQPTTPVRPAFVQTTASKPSTPSPRFTLNPIPAKLPTTPNRTAAGPSNAAKSATKPTSAIPSTLKQPIPSTSLKTANKPTTASSVATTTPSLTTKAPASTPGKLARTTSQQQLTKPTTTSTSSLSTGTKSAIAIKPPIVTPKLTPAQRPTTSTASTSSIFDRAISGSKQRTTTGNKTADLNRSVQK